MHTYELMNTIVAARRSQLESDATRSRLARRWVLAWFRPAHELHVEPVSAGVVAERLAPEAASALAVSRVAIALGPWTPTVTRQGDAAA